MFYTLIRKQNYYSSGEGSVMEIVGKSVELPYGMGNNGIHWGEGLITITKATPKMCLQFVVITINYMSAEALQKREIFSRSMSLHGMVRSGIR